MNSNSKFILKSIFVILVLIIISAAALFSYSLIAGKLKLPYGDDRISKMLERGAIPDSWQKSSSKDSSSSITVDQHRLAMIYTTVNESITKAYIEIINTDDQSVYYMEIPLNTKVSLSAELFNTLKDYGPELPQYIKLNRVEGYFSRKYRYAALTKIIEEITDTKFDCYMAVSEESFTRFLTKGLSDTKDHEFFEAYDTMVLEGYNDIDNNTAYAYYETYLENYLTSLGQIPGTWDVTDYILSSVTARETIEKYRY